MAIIDFLLKRFNFIKAYYKPVYGIMLTVFLFVASLAFGVKHYRSADEMERLLTSQYIRAVSDVSLMVDNIEANLTKGIVATGAKEISKIANRIYTDTAIAGMTLGQIPIFGSSVSEVSAYLTRLGDYTYALSLKKTDGGEITDSEYDTLEDFMVNIEKLSHSLKKLSEEIYGNRVNLLDITRDGYEAFKESHPEFSAAAEEGGQHFAALPSLIYDGPYSDHIKNKESLLLKDKALITKDQALDVVKKLFGSDFKGHIAYSGETSGKMPTYTFTATVESDKARAIDVEVTKRGGAISLILDNRYVAESLIEIEKAKRNAYSFLSRYDFGKMQDTYYEIADNTVIINFASVQNDVVCYTDLVKVKIALDNGELLGIECAGYIANHHKRTIPSFSFSEEEIHEALSPKVIAEKTSKCLIPTESGGEVFCYEVRCSYKDKTFLVYLNAETLKEENILILTETATSSLTI